WLASAPTWTPRSRKPWPRRALRRPRHVAPVLRGEVRWTSQGTGRPPWLVLSHDIFNARSGTVIAAAITSQPQRAGFPLTLEVKSLRLPKRSGVKIRIVGLWVVCRAGA